MSGPGRGEGLAKADVKLRCEGDDANPGVVRALAFGDIARPVEQCHSFLRTGCFSASRNDLRIREWMRRFEVPETATTT